MTNTNYRTESDLLGEKQIPADAYYGVQTLRAIENFQISGRKLSDYPNFIKGLAYTKKAAAIANGQVNMITNEQSEAIQFACDELLAGKYLDQFPVDMIQGGAGTSTNMCANEVIANIALEYMGHQKGEYQYCYPNDTVNGSQSTNDAYPCAVHMGLYLEHLDLLEHLKLLCASLDKKADEFKHIIKMGRTQLQDAVPMTLGQTFKAFAATIRLEMKNLKKASQEFLVHNMGATAIGTGICAFPGYSKLCDQALREVTGWEVKLADNLVEATSATTCLVQYSGALKRLSLRVNKICNDLRLMASGPRCGFGELRLPERQPGSSIMPGKVNPVIPEVMNQINYKVIGNDICVTMGCDNAQLELNVMEPVMTYSVFESVHLLINGIDTLRTLCIDGIKANEQHCKELVENSIGIVTMLNPYIGYKQSSHVAKEALETGRGVKELVLEYGYLTQEQYDKIMRPENMLEPVFVEGVPLNH